MRQRFLALRWVRVEVLLIVVLLLTACGSAATTQQRAGEGGGGGGQPVVVPTMPPARFTPVPQQSAASSALTQTIAGAQSTATAAVTTVDEQRLQRGATIYINRQCHECHGEQAEGITDKGAKLAGTQLTLAEFTTVLRTGGSGEIGPEHIFGPSAISPGGMEALYAWLRSLAEN